MDHPAVPGWITQQFQGDELTAPASVVVVEPWAPINV
ncbi:hypothetical protein ABIB25_001384 [Nakamurella sp. UYEF19]